MSRRAGTGHTGVLTEIADGVLVHRSELLRNNTVVVAGPSGALVVDPGLTRAELACLARDLRERGLSVVAGFATHPDWDHALWDDALGADVPRYASAAAVGVVEALRAQPDWREQVVAMLPEEIVEETPVERFGLLTALPDGADEVPWDGPRVRVLEHPAHSPGHAALVVEGARVLVAGDMLSDLFVPMLDDGADDPVAAHLTGLDVLGSVAGDVDTVVPGHGCVGRDVRERIALDRAYLHALRDGRDPRDPRLDDVEPGWEWVRGIHEGQARLLDDRSPDGPGVTPVSEDLVQR